LNEASSLAPVCYYQWKGGPCQPGQINTPAGNYCPLCAKQFRMKDVATRIPNPHFIKEVE